MATKKLAKELGLLRQQRQSSNGLKKSLVSNQIFSYLIVIDFESTCWRENKNYRQEIIEFPAVLLNTSTGEVESEFHTYVQPQEHAILSEFCTELTGITQMQVEAGIPLQICLSQFKRWLENLQLTMGVVFPNRQQMSSAPSVSQNLCTFLTWSDWDLGVCLQYECKRKQLHKPDVLNSWIDLRSTYRLFYNRKPKGLNGALQDLGIQFAGREHSGLDDSRNTAQLAARMMRDGCVLKITRSLVRMPLMVKPICGNTAEHNRKDKSNTHKEENQLSTNKPLSNISPKACPMTSCSEVIMSHLDTKENARLVQKSVQICQSLISSKTLLNNPNPTLWRPASSEAVTNTALVVRNLPSPHSSSNSLVLCSTTVGCISNEPHQTLPSITGDTGRLVEEDEPAEHFLMDTEDRCDSYDNVVLEADDDVISEKEREFCADHVSEFDRGCHVWTNPDNTHLSGNRVILRECMSNENKTQKMTNEESMTSLYTNNINSKVDVCNRFNETRQHSIIFEPSNYLAAAKTVTLDSNQCKSGLKTSLQVQRLSNGPHESSQTNTSFPLRRKPFMPEKTSAPNSSFATPKAVVRQHTNHKGSPKVSFTIYTDPPKSSGSSSTSSFCISKNALSSSTSSILSPSTNYSSHYVSVKGGQRITSPLCACGRRTKRQVVSNGGPNNGRVFYYCPVHRSDSGGRIQKGCDFFKWESTLMKRSSVSAPAVGSSVSLCQTNLTLSHRPTKRSTVRKSC